MEKKRDIAKENEGKYKTKCKEICDRKARERKFEIGDLVFVRNPVNRIHGCSQMLSGPYVVTDALPVNTYQVRMPDRTNKCIKLHMNLLEKYVTPTLESCLTVEVIQNSFDFGPDLLGGDGSKITDPEIFLERKERKILRMLIKSYKDVLQSKPGKMKSTCIEIKTGDAYPIHMPAYRIEPKKLPLLEEEIKSLEYYNLQIVNGHFLLFQCQNLEGQLDFALSTGN